jgi:hypothetical protein
MAAPTGTDQHDKSAPYKTSKRVQAWFLGRSRDLWKEKYAELKVESKRLRQQVTDVCRSRADWRGKAEAALQEAETLRVQLAEFQARLNALPEEAPPKIGSSRPR